MSYVLLSFAATCLASIAAGFALRAGLAAPPVGRTGDPSPEPAALHATRRQGWSGLASATLRPDRSAAVVTVWLLALDSALALAAPWPVKIVIDRMLGQPFTGGLAPLNRLSVLSATICVAVAGIALLAIGSVVGYLITYLTTSLAERSAVRLRMCTMAHLLAVPPERAATYSTGELANRVSADTARVADALVTVVEVVVPEICLLIGMTVITGLLDWRLMLAALGFVPLVAMTTRIRNRSLEPAARDSRARAGELAARTTDVLSRLRAVHVFGQATAELRTFAQASAASAHASVRAVDAGARFSPATDTLPGLGLAAALSLGAMEVHSGRITVGTLVLFLAYLAGLTAPVHALAGLSGTLTRAAASRERLRELLVISPLASVAHSHVAATADGKTEMSAIEVTEVAVGSRRVGPGVSFTVAPGEFVCLAGQSGSGKTTILSLLCRLVEPTSGMIRIGGQDIADIEPAVLRRMVTLVPQDSWLHTGSIADNIRYGRPEADQAQIRRAAERAGAAQFIAQLPDGYDTPVGELGLRLSGGQQRRIALARALLLDTPILLLDEPTDGLDGRAHVQVIDTLKAITDRTVVVATHDCELVRAADRVVRIAGRDQRGAGRVCPVGQVLAEGRRAS